MSIQVKNLEEVLSDYLRLDKLHLERGDIYLLERRDNSFWLVVNSAGLYKGVPMENSFVDISNSWESLTPSHPDNKFKLKGTVDLVFCLS